jgi:hypothetical protein
MLLARDMPGDRERARQLLIGVIEQYERLGMTPWMGRASELLGTRRYNGLHNHRD